MYQACLAIRARLAAANSICILYKHINFLCHIANNIVAVFVTGNVSEYQASELADAISEAASVRSERSTNLDDAEDEDDNLSDMVSANVSGRG